MRSFNKQNQKGDGRWQYLSWAWVWLVRWWVQAALWYLARGPWVLVLMDLAQERVRGDVHQQGSFVADRWFPHPFRSTQHHDHLAYPGQGLRGVISGTAVPLKGSATSLAG